MRIERFEDIEAWQLARELTHKVYSLTKKAEFARDFGLKGQIQDAPALRFEISSRHTSGGLAYEQGQSFDLEALDRRKKGNPER